MKNRKLRKDSPKKREFEAFVGKTEHVHLIRDITALNLINVSFPNQQPSITQHLLVTYTKKLASFNLREGDKIKFLATLTKFENDINTGEYIGNYKDTDFVFPIKDHKYKLNQLSNIEKLS